MDHAASRADKGGRVTPKFQVTREARHEGIESQILWCMGKGYKDEAIAKRLGMSVRNVRRYISDYQIRVGATSRFQTGMIAAKRGDV